ncbi:hypothetical protein [Haloquadratum walsbyi]|nr:hypothetical protein [Haloquadratum walsbyi]
MAYSQGGQGGQRSDTARPSDRRRCVSLVGVRGPPSQPLGLDEWQ